MFIAFYHAGPEMGAAAIFSMILPLWILKVIFALLDTPFVYLGVKWLASGEEKENLRPEEGRETGIVKGQETPGSLNRSGL